MAVHKLEKPARKRKARKARRNGARARTSVSNGAHSKRRARKPRRNGARRARVAAAPRKPRGKRVFRRNGSGRKVVRRRRNGVVSNALTNTGKPVEMILTAGAGALGAVAVGAIAQGLTSGVAYFQDPKNAMIKNAIPGVAAAAIGLGIAKFSKSKGGKTAGVAMALAGAVILVKDVAGGKVTELVNNVLPKDKQAALPGKTAGYEAMAGYRHMAAFGHEAAPGLAGFMVHQDGTADINVGQAAGWSGY